MSQQQPEFFGKYILLEKLATGGMAEVYLAKLMGAENVAKYFAIKRILPQFSQNQEFIEMFKEEAKIAVNLSNSNVVSIYEFGEQSGQFYIVMEFVEGRNLRQILNKLQKANQKFSIDQIAYIVGEVAKGLDHAHRCVDGTTGRPLNITHRDMSPQNVMVSFSGEVKIVDFGIAKAESKIENTKAGTLKGKFGYMSPEQAEGLEVDFRTDIFSLGIVLWELLASERLFISNNEVNTLRKIRDCVVPSLRKIDPEVPQELERIVNKALARDRNLRYQSASELQRDISRFMNRQYPDFSPQDFGSFIKTVFDKEREESRQKMIEYAKIAGPMGEKTEYIGDNTKTLTATNTNRSRNDDSPQLQNLISEEKMKSLKNVELDVNLKRHDILKQTMKSFGENSGVTSRTNIGLPPFGTNTSYTATVHRQSSVSFFRFLFLVALVAGAGYYVKEHRPELIDMVLGTAKQANPPTAPGESQLASKDPGVPDVPPLPTTAKILVRSNPMGATIQVGDDVKEAKTPAEIEVPINKPLKIILSKQGYAHHQTETVFNKDGESIDATLQRADFAFINIRVRPAPALIYLDRRYIGRSPIEKLQIPANKEVEILAYDQVSGAQDSEKITVKADVTKDVDLFLRRSTKKSRSTSSQKK